MDMMDGKLQSDVVGGYLFWVTPDGVRKARERHEFDPPEPTKAQMRYRSFLKSDGCMTFGEWLKAQKE
jgi:hypothetical protein